MKKRDLLFTLIFTLVISYMAYSAVVGTAGLPKPNERGVLEIVPYITPATGVTYSFDDLVELSGGAVIKTDGEYIVQADITISATDELLVDTDITVKIAKDKVLTIDGSRLIINSPSESVFTAVDSAEPYATILINENSYVRLKKATFTYGRGMRVLDADFVMDSCTMNNHDYSSQSSAAVSTTRGKVTVRNSTFKNNVRSAFGSGANMGCTFDIENCYLENNVTENSNRPQINLGPAREGETTTIIGCTIIGNRENIMVGGISTSSLLSVATKYLIERNTIKDNRYGITFTGSNITGTIKNNILTDNNTQNKPALGGSGINITASNGNTHAIVTGNTISGHLWGITLVGNTTTYATGPTANIGNVAVDVDDPEYNIGMNTFSNNGNGGVDYDLYNNTPNDVMAQNNTWGVEVQDETSIATVVVDKSDDSKYGRVTYMPPYNPELIVSIPTNVVAVENENNVNLTWTDGAVEQEKVAETYRNQNSVPVGYKVYRFLAQNKDNPFDWDLLNTTPVTELSFVDEGWSELETGVYMYAVKALYEGNIISEAGYSEAIEMTGVKYKVTYNTPTHGTLTVKNGDKIVTNGAMIEEGTMLTVTATPEEGYDLDKLTANNSDIENNSVVTVDSAIVIEVIFKPKKYVVNIDVDNIAGRLDVEIDKIRINSGDLVDYGTELAIIATPNGGCALDKLYINEDLIGTLAIGIRTFYYTVVSETNIKARFQPIPHVDERDVLHLDIYPNPVKDILNIVGEYTSVEVYGVSGNLIMTANAEGKLNFANLPDGLYLVKVKHNDKTAIYKIAK